MSTSSCSTAASGLASLDPLRRRGGRGAGVGPLRILLISAGSWLCGPRLSLAKVQQDLLRVERRRVDSLGQALAAQEDQVEDGDERAVERLSFLDTTTPLAPGREDSASAFSEMKTHFGYGIIEVPMCDGCGPNQNECYSESSGSATTAACSAPGYCDSCNSVYNSTGACCKQDQNGNPTSDSPQEYINFI